MRNPLRDPGFSGLGNGHAGPMRFPRASTGKRWQQSAAHGAASSESLLCTGRYETPGRHVEFAPHGAARSARVAEVVPFRGDPSPPAAEAREGAERAPSQHAARPGGPAQFLARLLTTWDLEPEAALVLLGLEASQRPYLDDLLEGKAALTGRDIKDRIAHLTVIRMTLAGLFADDTVENAWLREPHRPLEDRAPMSLMLGGSMDNLLLVREYVDTAAGL